MKNLKRISHSFFSLCVLLVIFISSCRENCVKTLTYTGVFPIYMALSDMRAVAKVEESRVLENPQKIYTYGDWLFIVEQMKGIHLVDNSDVSNPRFLKFLNMPGCVDVSVVGDYLYAVQGPDLVIWDISDVANIQFNNRFQSTMNKQLIKADSFPVDEEERQIVEVIDDANCGGGFSRGGFFESDILTSSGGVPNASGNQGQSGMGGSMSTFTILGNNMYIVDQNNIRALNVSDPSNPTMVGNVEVSAQVETIMANGTKLFLGTTTGMLVYETKDNPTRPEFISIFSHVRGCDPVVVYGNLAYVTLRGNSNCGQAANELLILNISDIKNPRLESSYPMTEPYGLGVDKELLVLCDGPSGMKIFDRSRTFDMTGNLLAVDASKKAYDVILYDKHCILSAEEGIFQYDLTNPAQPIQLSTLLSR